MASVAWGQAAGTGTLELRRPYAGFSVKVFDPWKPMTTSPEDDYMLLLSRIVDSRITMILSVSVYKGPGLTLERFAATQKSMDGRGGRGKLIEFSRRERRVGERTLETVRSLVTAPANPAIRYYRECVVDGRVLYLVELEHRETDAAVAKSALDEFLQNMTLSVPRNCNREVHAPDTRIAIRGGAFTFMYPSTFQREQEDPGALFVAQQWNPDSTLMLPAIRVERVGAAAEAPTQALLEARTRGWVTGRKELGEEAVLESVEPFAAPQASGHMAILKTTYTHPQLKKQITKCVTLALFKVRDATYAFEVAYQSDTPEQASALMARLLGNIEVVK